MPEVVSWIIIVSPPLLLIAGWRLFFFQATVPDRDNPWWRLSRRSPLIPACAGNSDVSLGHSIGCD